MNKNKYVIAMSFAVAAILCYTAGQPRFALLPSRIADFAGLALILISGICWSLPIGKKPGSKSE